MNPFSVLIIGAGRIGAFHDTPQSPAVRSHAHAFSLHPGFTLEGFADADDRQSAKAAALWGGAAFDSVPAAFAGRTIDVAVVAAADEAHYTILKMLAGLPVRCVLAEKPLTKTVGEAREIVALYCERGISLCVNFSRRFVPEVIDLRKRIASDAFGRFLSGTGTYGKGALHNGSHLVDLLRYLLGEIADARCVSAVHDWRENDPTCSAVLDLANGAHFFMQGIDSRFATIFEADLFFERQRVRIVDFGMRIETYGLQPRADNPGQLHYEPPVHTATGHADVLSFSADHLHAHLAHGAPLCSSGADGLAAQLVCGKILDGARGAAVRAASENRNGHSL